jgi:2-methylaconitate cis-trans-isomerase PrpF
MTFASTLFLRALLATTVVCVASAATASTTQPALTEATCQNEMVKFEQTMGYLRQTSGDQAASTVQDKLLPAKTREELLAKEGPCGVVRFLRAKKVL